MATVRVQTGRFDAGAWIRRMHEANPGVGAVAAFVGVVRDLNDGDQVSTMTLEHYPGMTERAFEEIAVEAARRWRIVDTTIIHRVGQLAPTDPIVLVVTASAHRGDAFSACEFIMDFLKTRAPLWKKEHGPEGARWVDARASDDDAAARWTAEHD